MFLENLRMMLIDVMIIILGELCAASGAYKTIFAVQTSRDISDGTFESIGCFVIVEE